MDKNALSMTVTEGLTVTILPNSNYEFLMSTTEVANGYGTSKYSIRKSFLRNSNELIEGKHFVKGVDIMSPPAAKEAKAQPHQIFWTKRGIVRLGFFIKSERAKLFRDWAEELVLEKLTPQPPKGGVVAASRQLPARRKHNRLTSERLLDIMADVARIDDRDVRIRITNKLMGGRSNGNQ